MAKLNADGCGPCEFVVLSVSSEKSREFYCKTDTPENRTTWGGVIQTVINRLIEGRATFHGKPFFAPLPLDARTSAPDQASPFNSTPRATSTTSDSSEAAPSSPGGQLSSSPYANPYASSSSGVPSTQQSGQNSPQASPRTPHSPHLGSSDSIGSASSFSQPNLALPRASMALPAPAFGSPGPMVQFNPVGAQEIVRVFLPDQSSKTLLFDTNQTVEALAQQVRKKLGAGGYDHYALFVFALGDSRLLPTDASVISQVMQWPTKNDPEHYRLVFQPEQESDREKASTIGFLEVKTSANAHSSSVQKSSSFVSQMMGAVRSKPEWTGNIPLASVPTPHLHRGVLAKKSSSSITGGSKDILAIVTETAFYYFDANASPQDKSKGWIPLEKTALYKDRSPTSFIFYYIHPGTLDLSRSLEITCRTEDDKKTWITILEPRCKGALPIKAKPQRRTGSAPAVGKPKEATKADVGAMLQSTPSEGPKLVHLTAGRPKGAGKRPPTARPKTSAPAPLGSPGPLTGSGDYTLHASASFDQPFTSSPMASPSSQGGFVPESSPRYGGGYGSAPSSTATASTGTPNSTPGSTPNGSLVTPAPGATSPRYDQTSGYSASPAPTTAYSNPSSNNPYNANNGYMSSSPAQSTGGYLQPSGSSGQIPSSRPPPMPVTSPMSTGSPRPGFSNDGSSPRLNGSSGGIPSGSPSSPRFTPPSPRPLQPTNTTVAPYGSTKTNLPPLPSGFDSSPSTASPYTTATSQPAGPYSTATGPSYTSTTPQYTSNNLNSIAPQYTASVPSYTSTTNNSSSPYIAPSAPLGTTSSPYMLSNPSTMSSANGSSTNAYQQPAYSSTFSNPAIASSGSGSSLNMPAARPLVAPTPLSGPVLTGPNPAQMQTVPARGSPSPILSPPGLAHPGQQFSNPALNNSAPQMMPIPDGEPEVLDIKSLLGYGSPALPKQQAFPPYQSPHISGTPLAPAKGSTIMYSPVLAKPMPIQNTSSHVATEPKPITPFNSGASTTISISGTPNQSLPQQSLASPFTNAPNHNSPILPPAGTISLAEAPTPIIMDLGAPQLDLSSPFDDCPFE